MVTPLTHSFPDVERRTAERYTVHFPVEVRWYEDATGERVVSEGITQNVGASGALVSLKYLLGIGRRLSVTIREATGALIEAPAEVVRLNRNSNQTGTAALYILGDNQQWQASVWEAARREALNEPDSTDKAQAKSSNMNKKKPTPTKSKRIKGTLQVETDVQDYKSDVRKVDERALEESSSDHCRPLLPAATKELESSNEELTTLNEELRNRNLELGWLTNDLTNLLASVQMPILMLDNDLHIRRFTPTAKKMLNLIATDVGRLIDDIRPTTNVPDLKELIEEAINTTSVIKREVQDTDGRWFSLQVRPYRTLDNKVDGAVLVLVDIDALKRSAAQIRESRDYAANIIATMREPLVIFDEDLRVQTAGRCFYETFKVTPEETENQFIYDVGNGQWNIPALRTLLEDILPAQNQFENFEVEHEFERIGRKTMLLSASEVHQDVNRKRLILLAIKDITERKRSEEAMRQSEERFRLLVKGVRDYAIFMLDPKGRIVSWNPGVKRILGYEEAEFTGQHVSIIYTPEDIDQNVLEHELKTATTEGRAESERWQMRRDGTRFWTSGVVEPLHDEMGGLRGFSKVMRDITERKAIEERIIHETFHDALTGLPNRALFIEHLQRAIAYTERYEKYLFAVLFLDLDRFKSINDSLGHVIGDQLLAATARKLETALRPEDVVARFGGDEFSILLNNIHSISDATRVANRIHDELRLPFQLGGHDVFITASIGIALSTHSYSETEEVLRDADTAMYRAKSLGRGRHEIFDPSMHEHVMAQLKLEADLKLAVERKEFLLHYQPIVSLENNQITGFEALVRWQHPERGLVLPDEFIPIAEETGLIAPVGRWVLHEACRQASQWQDQSHGDPPLSVNVNISGKQFSQADLIEQIESVLEQTGLSARSLKLEITESVVMEKAEATTTMLGQLRDLGVKLHIDDFGTGYSSLSYLHRLPVDVLKIDRSFVSRMEFGDENSEIVRTIVRLAHNLGMEVTAEGVETAEQVSKLSALECEYGQGYFFSKPVDSEGAKRMIAA